jgi:hypothetical protein
VIIPVTVQKIIILAGSIISMIMKPPCVLMFSKFHMLTLTILYTSRGGREILLAHKTDDKTEAQQG